MRLSIVDLNDDCLLQIFRRLALSSRLRLPFVCKRFYSICKRYEVNNVQNALGVLHETNCDHSSHRIDDEDTIFNLILERMRADNEQANHLPNPNKSLRKFEMPRLLFEQLLIRCGRLKVLSLRMVDVVDNRILNLIVRYCRRLEHLTISTTTIQASNLVWLELCTSTCPRLKCLCLEHVDGLSDHFISNILRKSTSLEHFAITGNDQQLQGYFLENLCDQIQSVSLKKADLFSDHGASALMSLIAGNFELFPSNFITYKSNFIKVTLK